MEDVHDSVSIDSKISINSKCFSSFISNDEEMQKTISIAYRNGATWAFNEAIERACSFLEYYFKEGHFIISNDEIEPVDYKTFINDFKQFIKL